MMQVARLNVGIVGIVGNVGIVRGPLPMDGRTICGILSPIVTTLRQVRTLPKFVVIDLVHRKHVPIDSDSNE